MKKNSGGVVKNFDLNDSVYQNFSVNPFTREESLSVHKAIREFADAMSALYPMWTVINEIFFEDFLYKYTSKVICHEEKF